MRTTGVRKEALEAYIKISTDENVINNHGGYYRHIYFTDGRYRFFHVIGIYEEMVFDFIMRVRDGRTIKSRIDEMLSWYTSSLSWENIKYIFIGSDKKSITGWMERHPVTFYTDGAPINIEDWPDKFEFSEAYSEKRQKNILKHLEKKRKRVIEGKLYKD